MAAVIKGIMLKTERQIFVENKPESVRYLYDKYAGMLLGYIFEIVKDSKLAEEYLVEVFCELSRQFDKQNWEGPSNWCQLQRFARNQLASIASSEPAPRSLATKGRNDHYLQQLSEIQQRIFLDAYYHGKTIAVLSVELNRTEEFIRKTLKEAFAILRKSGEN